MYTKGEFDNNLRRMMKSDSLVASESLRALANYMELKVQLDFLEKLREVPDLCTDEEYKKDLKTLAKRAGFKFTEDEKEGAE